MEQDSKRRSSVGGTKEQKQDLKRALAVWAKKRVKLDHQSIYEERH